MRHHLLPLLLLAPAALCTALADTYTPGDTTQPGIENSTSCGHVIPALLDYLDALRRHPLDPSDPARAHEDILFYRYRAIDTLRRYPKEANDSLVRTDGSWATPLSLAIELQDEPIVSLLLDELNALPLAPMAGATLAGLQPAPGTIPKPRLNERVQRLLACYNPLEIALQGEREGAIDSRSRSLQVDMDIRKSNARRALEVGIENIFGAEPSMTLAQSYQVYKVYNRLDAPHRVMLRLQPVHILFEPAPEKNGRPTDCARLTTTARIVETIKGKPLAQQYIRYTISHEGNDYQGPQGDVGPEAEERLMSTTTQALAAAKAQGDTLDMGFFDWSECPRSKFWNWAIGQAFRICPELRETTPASEQELAAAQQLLEQYPIFVRADIEAERLTLDEQAGEAIVHYKARLRHPLLSGTIKGSTPHERQLSYERRFPLTDAWRARHAASEQGTAVCRPPLRAILALDEADGKARVVQAWDSESDEALLRALNELTIKTSYRGGWK